VRGRISQGANKPGGERARGERARGESSRGRNGKGAKKPDTLPYTAVTFPAVRLVPNYTA